MDHLTAQKLMGVYECLGQVINEADPIIRTLPEAERVPHLHALAGAMFHLWFELQLPIVRDHPDLDPDGTRFRT
jgi:hypothetical protein